MSANSNPNQPSNPLDTPEVPIQVRLEDSKDGKRSLVHITMSMNQSIDLIIAFSKVLSQMIDIPTEAFMLGMSDDANRRKVFEKFKSHPKYANRGDIMTYFALVEALRSQTDLAEFDGIELLATMLGVTCDDPDCLVHGQRNRERGTAS